MYFYEPIDIWIFSYVYSFDLQCVVCMGGLHANEYQDIIEMKVSHRRNIMKRKTKFGYESTSTIGANLGALANVIAPDVCQDDDDDHPELQ